MQDISKIAFAKPMDESPMTILGLLSRAATTNACITTYAPNGAPSKSFRTSYSEFQARAEHNARMVHQSPGISPGTVVLLHFDRHSDNFDWFWATTIAEYLPAFSTPLVNDLDQRRKHLAHLHDVLEDPIVLTTEALTAEFSEFPQLRLCTVESLGQTDGYASTVSSELPAHGQVHTGLTNGHFSGMSNEISKGHAQVDEPKCESPNSSARRDIAVLMLTSGSTGNAKAVCLRHHQIIHSIRSKDHRLGLTHDDVLLNWIGMDHVVNLVEMHL